MLMTISTISSGFPVLIEAVTQMIQKSSFTAFRIFTQAYSFIFLFQKQQSAVGNLPFQLYKMPNTVPEHK